MLDRTDPQIQWLEDFGPAMNEHEAWQTMSPYLNNFGIATRLENAAAASVPDVLYITGGLMIFIELKINHGGHFYMNPFQWAYGNRIRHHLRPHFHWVAVWDDGFRMFSFLRVRQMSNESRGHKLKFHWQPIWEKMPTKFHLQRENDYKNWLDAILKLEFGE
jgi:hypothetical protein